MGGQPRLMGSSGCLGLGFTRARNALFLNQLILSASDANWQFFEGFYVL